MFTIKNPSNSHPQGGYPTPTMLTSIPVNCILPNPYQPRKVFPDESLQDLCESIRQVGLIQPISVRKLGGPYYELIAGERRLRACRMAGIRRIDAIVLPANDQDSAMVALVENLQRENLSFFEEAEGYYNLINEHGFTQEELARRMGKTQSAVANKLRLLKLSPAIRRRLAESTLSERHARALLRIHDEKVQEKLLEQFISRDMTVRAAEELVEMTLQKLYADRSQRGEDLGNVKPRVKRAMRDSRLLLNTFRRVAKDMRVVGANIQYEESASEEFWEVHIRIPKNRGEKGAQQLATGAGNKIMAIGGHNG